MLSISVLNETTATMVSETTWDIAAKLFPGLDADIDIDINVVIAIPLLNTRGLWEFSTQHIIHIVADDEWHMTLAHEMYHVFQHENDLAMDEGMAEMFGRWIVNDRGTRRIDVSA